MSTAPNPRASLLAGLRTGGVRSASANIPHTAAPAGSFNVPRFSSQQHSNTIYPEDEDDHLPEIPIQNVFVNHPGARVMPMTAAVDGANNRFSQQQQAQRPMDPNSLPFNPSFAPNVMPQNQMVDPFQMQMMQLELMKIQAFQQMVAQQQQQQQIQQLHRQQILQAQQQQQQQHYQSRRASVGFVPPATAGPTSTSFDLRSATLNGQLRRASANDQQKYPGVVNEESVPMTAALGGKFGSRVPGPASSRYEEEVPPLSSNTTVISGGTSLGNLSNTLTGNNSSVSNPSKSDAATSWRRGGNNNSVLSGNNRSLPSPSVKITPPPEERVSPPPQAIGIKTRPQPLQFNAAASQSCGSVAIDMSAETHEGEEASSASSKSAGSNTPPTPHSPPNESPLSPREEDSKRIYESLGIGLPGTGENTYHASNQAVSNHRMVNQPLRQPRGPPSGAEELGPRNFARMVRRKAVGGLGLLVGARERRESVEAY